MLEDKYHDMKRFIESLSTSLKAFEDHYSDYLILRHFYGSKEWYQAIEQRDKVHLKTDILSEDLLYNLIVEHNQLIERFLDLTAKMYKHL
ncbi:DUF4298 domain-containing protein [Streptococcus pluranimalium]|uniref:DUF4298 domain-containing protein n=1 Tax=Streptococcus pluranimalium TaxID=82348 RepID=UPI003BF83EDF